MLAHDVGMSSPRLWVTSSRGVHSPRGPSRTQNSNTKIRELAAMLVTAHDHGEFAAALTRLTVTAAAKTDAAKNSGQQ